MALDTAGAGDDASITPSHNVFGALLMKATLSVSVEKI